MTAQHAPHTPPMWRQVLSLPQSRLGWLAVGLSAVGVALVFMLFMLGRFFGIIPEGYGVGALITTLLITSLLGGGVVGSLALGAAERSLLVWVTQVPTALFFAFFTSFLLGEGNYPWVNYPWVRPSLGVLFWAVIALGIIYLMRSAERMNVRWFE